MRKGIPNEPGFLEKLSAYAPTLPETPANFTVESGDNSGILEWSEPEDFSIERWLYQQNGGRNETTRDCPPPAASISNESPPERKHSLRK